MTIFKDAASLAGPIIFLQPLSKTLDLMLPASMMDIAEVLTTQLFSQFSQSHPAVPFTENPSLCPHTLKGIYCENLHKSTPWEMIARINQFVLFSFLATCGSAQRLLLALHSATPWLRGPYGLLAIKPRSAAHKVIALPAILSLWPPDQCV